MKQGAYILIIVILLVGLILAMNSPDSISMLFIGVMEAVIFLGVSFGVLPVTNYSRAFQTAMENINAATVDRSGSTWAIIENIEDFFRQRTLDTIFYEYQAKVKGQRESGQILSDIDDYVNEEALALHSWQSIVTQIPGTLTGLGLLGTFVGLIIGIQGIEFTSVNMALLSVQSLLSGIQIAFYTSIAGVILSLMFNILYRLAWNTMVRQLGLFSSDFHRKVVPPVEEQTRYRERRDIRQITELLDRLPKNQGYSTAAGGNIGGGVHAPSAGNEQIMMPQILSGIRDGEFIFYLQPRCDLNTKAIVGAEALVRWSHGKLGLVSPAVFIPILESNGYITKLDQYIWERVCATIQEWVGKGLRPVPISINVTKTDVLAMDVADFISSTVAKYAISPLNLVVEIAENAYFQATTAVIETEKQLRQKGFRVIVDGFNGDYFALNSVEGFSADSLKLDLRRFSGKQNQAALNDVFMQAQKLRMQMSVEGIENMEQLTMLRKCGCTEGQGFYLFKPISVEEFEEITSMDKKEKAEKERLEKVRLAKERLEEERLEKEKLEEEKPEEEKLEEEKLEKEKLEEEKPEEEKLEEEKLEEEKPEEEKPEEEKPEEKK